MAINVYGANGAAVNHEIVEERANEHNISLRTGCFCNPGAGEIALGLTQEELTECFDRPDSRMTIDEFRQCIDSESSGAIRVSVGLVTNFEDVWKLVEFMGEFRER